MAQTARYGGSVFAPSLMRRTPMRRVLTDFETGIFELHHPQMERGDLNANPRVDEAYYRVPPPGFKYLVTEMVCWAGRRFASRRGQSFE